MAEIEAMRAKIAAMERQEPFDANSDVFRGAFEAALKAGNWPATRQGDGYRSPSTQIAWRIAFSTVNRLKLYLAPGAKENEMWQPIETAPKDQFLLLCGPSGYTTTPMVVTTGRMCSDYHTGRWLDHTNDDLTDWGFKPTHWAPLTLPGAKGE